MEYKKNEKIEIENEQRPPKKKTKKKFGAQGCCSPCARKMKLKLSQNLSSHIKRP